MYTIILLNFQVDWDTYGVDWDGPVPLDDDANTVTVEELGVVLTDTQKDELQVVLSPLSTKDYCQRATLGQFALAKSFVNQVYVSYNYKSLSNYLCKCCFVRCNYYRISDIKIVR